MKSDFKVFVIGSYHEGISHIKWLNSSNDMFELTDNIEDADIAVFTGGEDVTPEFYGEKRHKRTYPNEYRDVREFAYAMYCLENNIKMIGVCRGAQLLCTVAGGKLVQHTTGHTGKRHEMWSDWGLIEVNSLHHQMMYPWNLKEEDYKLLGWSENELSATYEGAPDEYFGNEIPYINEAGELTKVEPEVIYFKNIDALCIQYHPEMMTNKDDIGQVFAGQLANDLMEN